MANADDRSSYWAERAAEAFDGKIILALTSRTTASVQASKIVLAVELADT
jgi:hypothetical protein